MSQKKGQSRLFFLRWLTSFNVCSDMLCMLYHAVIESALCYAIVCWGSGTTDKNCRRLDKLVKKKASSVVGRRLHPLSAVVEQRMRTKLCSVLDDNNRHPLPPVHCFYVGRSLQFIIQHHPQVFTGLNTLSPLHQCRLTGMEF